MSAAGGRDGPDVLWIPSWYPSREAPIRGVFFREQARALRRSGVNVAVAYPELRRLRSLRRGGWWRHRFQVSVGKEGGLPTVRVHGWNVPWTWFRGRLFTDLARRAAKTYADIRGMPDLLHAHSALWAGVAARKISRDLGVPYVLTEHSSAFARGLLQPWQLERVHEACAGASTVLAVSRAVAEEMRAKAGVSDVTVVPNMVDTGLFTLPPEARSSTPFRFLTVATLRPNKRVDLLLRAFARAFPDNEDIRLVIAGDGRSRPDLQRLAADLGVAGRIRFPGRLGRRDVRDAMWSANVYVLSSEVETFGIALVEAMATGLPVIATRSGGPEELVDEEAGWLVEPGDVHGMADALWRARESEPRLRARDGEIRSRVVSRYGEEAVTRRLREIYLSVAGGVPEARADG